MACMPLCVSKRSLAREDMARGVGAKSARLFAMGITFDLLSLGRFDAFRDTVVRK